MVTDSAAGASASSLGASNRFYPARAQLDMVMRIRASLEKATELLGKTPTSELLDKVIAENYPRFTLEADLRAAILSGKSIERNVTYVPQGVLARMVSRQTGFYWGTTGHTTEPTFVGAMGPGEAAFRGYMDDTDVARALHRLIGAQ